MLEAEASPASPAGADDPAGERLPETPPVLHEIELALPPDQAALVARRQGVSRDGATRSATVIWYDDPEATLGQQNLILGRQDGFWELQPVGPGQGRAWPAVIPPPVLSRAATLGELDPTPPFDVTPVAAFEGKRHQYRAGGVTLQLMTGTLRGVVQSQPVCRLRLRGDGRAVQAAVAALDPLPLSVPRASLAKEALAVARGERVTVRPKGSPSVQAGLSVSDGLASLLSELLDTLLHWADRFRAAPEPDAVHQARVATRRLRSVLTLYRSAAGCPEMAELAAALRTCATRLGAARDWDVFLAGTGARLAEHGAGDRRLAGLLRAARRSRDAEYAALGAYLRGPEFRRLELALGVSAALRPWDQSADQGEEDLVRRSPGELFAASVLHRRLKRVRRRGRRLDDLPLPELHELRKDCKKLRYAVEFFVPLFPKATARPLLKRLTTLQEELGLLNDSATVAGLMRQLGRAGRGYAGGLIEGWAAAEAIPARRRVDEEWRKFKGIEPFWR